MFLLNQYKIGYSGIQAQYIGGFGIRVIATIDAYPFCFALEFDPKENSANPELDITSFFNEYEDKEYNMNFGLPILERNNIFSCDYRTKEQIKKCVEDNKNHKED